MVRPDYAGGGFVNLIASLVAACGGAPRHDPLAALLASLSLVLVLQARERSAGALLGKIGRAHV